MALEWFKSYLTERKQFVLYNDVKSDVKEITYGVPQGSVLGPLLFILYTNDIPYCLKTCKCILFADDTTVYVSGHRKSSLFTDMKNDLDSLIDWFRANKLSLNISKTNYVLFRPDKRMKMIDHEDVDKYNLTFGNDVLEEKYVVKFLGVKIDNHLKWNDHCKSLCSRLASSLYILRNVKHTLPTRIMKTLYYSFFYSHLQYGVLLWGSSTTAENINRICVMQKKAIRIVTNSNYNDHTAPLFKELNILNIDDIIKVELAKYMYKFTNNILPLELTKFLKRGNEIHGYATRQENPISIKRNFAPLDHCFLTKAPEVWKKLDRTKKESKSLKNFIANLKKDKTEKYCCLLYTSPSPRDS